MDEYFLQLQDRNNLADCRPLVKPLHAISVQLRKTMFTHGGKSSVRVLFLLIHGLIPQTVLSCRDEAEGIPSEGERSPEDPHSGQRDPAGVWNSTTVTSPHTVDV